MNRGQLRYVPFATINGSICYPFLFFLRASFVLCIGGKNTAFPAMFDFICIPLQFVSCCEAVTRGHTAHSMLKQFTI